MSYNQNQYQSGPYGQSPAAESGYGHGYGQQQPEQHELQPYSQQQQQYGQQQPQYGQPQYQQQQQQQPQASSSGVVLSQSEYLERVSHARNEIRSLTGDVQRIASLHQRALSGDDGAAEAQLQALVEATQLKNTAIRDQIRFLKADCERTADGTRALKKRQFDSLNNDFKKEVQAYLQEEQQYSSRYRDQIARQYRIVNPDAPEEEVRAAAERDWGNEGIFQQALSTNRYGEANRVLGAVRARHNELMRIEQSIAELAGLFQDIDTLAILQEATVVRAEEQVEQTNQHLQKGNQEVGVAVKHAKSRRKLFWWCIVVGILIVLAIGLGAGLGIYFAGKNAPPPPKTS